MKIFWNILRIDFQHLGQILYFLKLGVSFLLFFVFLFFCFCFLFSFCWLSLSSKSSIRAQVAQGWKNILAKKKPMAASRFEPLIFHLLDLRPNQLSYHDLMILKCSFWSNEFIMASKNVTSAASSQYMLEVHMSTIYHKGGISLAQLSPVLCIQYGMKSFWRQKKQWLLSFWSQRAPKPGKIKKNL